MLYEITAICISLYGAMKEYQQQIQRRKYKLTYWEIKNETVLPNKG